MTILSIKNLYKFHKKKCLINNVTIHLHSKEIVGLLGPNGSGKTTMFHIILGIIKHDSGHIFFNNKNISTFPIYLRTKLGISYLPQESSIFRNLTVFENLMAILQIQNFSNKKENKKLIQKTMNKFHINHLKNSLGRNLSGGERKRVEIARALISRPKFILFDEPFAGIDPISIINIQKIIKNLKNHNLGILITDHNVRDTLKICNRSYIFSKGKILIQGSSDEILCNEYVKKIYLGNSFKL